MRVENRLFILKGKNQVSKHTVKVRITDKKWEIIILMLKSIQNKKFCIWKIVKIMLL